ncbi:MAG: hypothetical protein ACRDJ2_16890 [Actinomycetota bacterium]
MVEQFGWRELAVLFGLVALVVAFRVSTQRARIVVGAAASLLVVLGVMWPKGLQAVARCYPDYDDVPDSATENADGLEEISEAIDAWRQEHSEFRFFSTC